MVIVSCLLLLFSLIRSIQYTLDYGGTDLRCRIVGSRLLLTNESPYFYKWQTGDNIRQLDPNDNRFRKVNGNVVTPAVLFINTPLAVLSYSYIRIIWTLLQFVLLGLSLFLIRKVSRLNKESEATALFVVAIYTCSTNWFFNIERGQTYVVYLFIFSLIYFLYNARNPSNHFLAGLITGISVWVRPLMICMNIPFLLAGNMRFLIGSGTGVLVGLLAFFLPFKVAWRHYFAAMKVYELESLGKSQPVTSIAVDLPISIEQTDNITHFKIDFITGILSNVQTYAMRFGIALDGFTLAIIFAIVVVMLAVFFIQVPAADSNMQKSFLFAFLLYILSELFIVGTRSPYNFVQWLPAMCLILIYSNNNKWVVFGILLSIACVNGFPVPHPLQFAMGESILLVLLFFCIFYDRKWGRCQPLMDVHRVL